MTWGYLRALGATMTFSVANTGGVGLLMVASMLVGW